MHVAVRFDVTTTCAAVIVRLVRLQKDIFSSDFDTAGQCEVHTSRSSEDMRAIPSDTARAIVWVLKEKGLGRMRPESSSKPKEDLLKCSTLVSAWGRGHFHRTIQKKRSGRTPTPLSSSVSQRPNPSDMPKANRQ